MVDIFVAKIEKKDTPKVSEEVLHKHPHIFYSFWENPDGITFEDKEDDETILLLIRSHFITNSHWLLVFAVLFLLPIFLLIFLPYLSPLSFFHLPVRYIVLFAILYYLIIFTYLFVNFITWYFNLSLITDKRVVDIHFADLVYKNVATTKLSLLEDVSFSQIGVIRGLFDYGDILMQTAGTLDNFSFTRIPKPERVVQIVEKLIGIGDKKVKI